MRRSLGVRASVLIGIAMMLGLLTCALGLQASKSLAAAARHAPSDHSEARASGVILDPVCRGPIYAPERSSRKTFVFGGTAISCFGSFARKLTTRRRVTVCVQRREGGRRRTAWRSLDCDRKSTATSFGRIILFAEARCRTGKEHVFRTRVIIRLRRGGVANRKSAVSRRERIRC